jgi:hypothetical protein
VEKQQRLATGLLVGLSLLATPVAAAEYGTLGIGWGIPYATLGLNFDIRVTRDFYLTESVGTGFSDTGYALGGRYYLHSPAENVRVRASAIYGVFGGVKYRNIDQKGAPVDKKGEDFASLAVGIGFTWMYGGGAGFDFDVLYVDTSSAERREAELEAEGYLINRTGAQNISVGVGYRMTID